MSRSRGRRTGPEISLAAMSDIAMLVLIFFIITTDFLVQRTLRPELPAITPEKEEATKDPITVKVKQTVIFLKDEQIQIEDLAPYLAAMLADAATEQERAVVLDGDAEVPYEAVVNAANEIKRAGGIITIMKVEE